MCITTQSSYETTKLEACIVPTLIKNGDFSLLSQNASNDWNYQKLHYGKETCSFVDIYQKDWNSFIVPSFSIVEEKGKGKQQYQEDVIKKPTYENLFLEQSNSPISR